jgi:simple sugar transport system permease protein
VAGNEYRAVAGMQPNLFFDAIVVSLMALNNPIGILPAALFVGALENSGIGLQIQTNVSVDLVTVIIGAIILFATVKRAGPVGLLWRWVRTHLFVVVASESSTDAAETSPPTVITVEPPARLDGQ